MKIIEAMKRIKLNKEKIADLQTKIAANSANLSYETPAYGDRQRAQVFEWVQSALDVGQENIRLLVAIQRTNLATQVTIELGGKGVTKCIAEWVWRRREYATIDYGTWAKLTDRGLKEGSIQQSTGQMMEVKLVRQYDPAVRDAQMVMYREEPTLIDGALELINATTDLLEV